MLVAAGSGIFLLLLRLEGVRTVAGASRGLVPRSLFLFTLLLALRAVGDMNAPLSTLVTPRASLVSAHPVVRLVALLLLLRLHLGALREAAEEALYVTLDVGAARVEQLAQRWRRREPSPLRHEDRSGADALLDRVVVVVVVFSSAGTRHLSGVVRDTYECRRASASVWVLLFAVSWQNGRRFPG